MTLIKLNENGTSAMNLHYTRQCGRKKRIQDRTHVFDFPEWLLILWDLIISHKCVWFKNGYFKIILILSSLVNLLL